jgi:hypothetical protein
MEVTETHRGASITGHAPSSDIKSEVVAVTGRHNLIYDISDRSSSLRQVYANGRLTAGTLGSDTR